MDTFPNKEPGAIVTLRFDFSGAMFASETMTSATATVAVYSGPQVVASLDVSATGQSVSEILVTVAGGESGNVYLVTALATTSDGQTLRLPRLLPVFDTTTICTPDDFMDEVAPDIPGATLLVLRHAIRRACARFLAESKSYRPIVTPMDVTAGEWFYTPGLPALMSICDERVIRYDGEPLLPLPQVWLNEAEITGDQQGTPRAYELEPDRRTVRILPKPDAALAGGLTIEPACYPTDECEWFPLILAQEYRDEIAHGAKAILFAQKGKPWSDPGLAKYHEDQFSDSVHEALFAAERNFTTAALRTKPAPI